MTVAIRWTPEQLDNYEARRMLGIATAKTTPPEVKATLAKACPTKAKPGPKGGSAIEELLVQQMAAAGLPIPIREYKHIPGRRFRLDFCWPGLSFGVEVQGMAHRIKEKFEVDIEKRMLGLLAGWTIAEVSGKTIRSGQAVKWIATLIEQIRGGRNGR